MRLRSGGPGTVVAAVAALALLGGCGLDADYRTRDVPRTDRPGKLVKLDCPSDGVGIDGIRPRDGRAATSPPTGFVATTAVVCRPEDFAAARSRITVFVEQAPVTPELIAALQLPDREFVDPAGGVCATNYVIQPYLLLVDDRGRGYRPVLPQTECSNVRDEVLLALTQSDDGAELAGHDRLNRPAVRGVQVSEEERGRW